MSTFSFFSSSILSPNLANEAFSNKIAFEKSSCILCLPLTLTKYSTCDVLIGNETYSWFIFNNFFFWYTFNSFSAFNNSLSIVFILFDIWFRCFYKSDLRFWFYSIFSSYSQIFLTLSKFLWSFSITLMSGFSSSSSSNSSSSSDSSSLSSSYSSSFSSSDYFCFSYISCCFLSFWILFLSLIL